MGLVESGGMSGGIVRVMREGQGFEFPRIGGLNVILTHPGEHRAGTPLRGRSPLRPSGETAATQILSSDAAPET